MKKRHSKNPFKILLCCMCLVALFGVQVVFAAEADEDASAGNETGQQSDDTSAGDGAQEESGGGTKTAGSAGKSSSGMSGGSVRAVGGQRQRARQVTDAQQELAHQIAEREEARTRQMEQ